MRKRYRAGNISQRDRSLSLCLIRQPAVCKDQYQHGCEQKYCKKEQTGDRHLIGCGRRKEIRNQSKADSVARGMEENTSDPASVRVIDYPRPDDADENTAQYKEGEIDRVEGAHLTGYKESGQMPHCPKHTENDSGEPRAESLLQMRGCEACPTCFFSDRVDQEKGE